MHVTPTPHPLSLLSFHTHCNDNDKAVHYRVLMKPAGASRISPSAHKQGGFQVKLKQLNLTSSWREEMLHIIPRHPIIEVVTGHWCGPPRFTNSYFFFFCFICRLFASFWSSCLHGRYLNRMLWAATADLEIWERLCNNTITTHLRSSPRNSNRHGDSFKMHTAITKFHFL